MEKRLLQVLLRSLLKGCQWSDKHVFQHHFPFSAGLVLQANNTSNDGYISH
jgi:hypothetical protein